jgi:hypothetical protein
MGDGAEAGAPSYRAFISYSHKDAAVGRWLHRRLEGYRLPRRLVGTEGERSPVPARLTPIFRDREELPAAGDLSETVRAALAVSESLIVVCSPNAAASPWVAKEISTFRTLHPDRPILAAIAEGEPPECFPPELTVGGRAEPLAADLRAGHDGRRLGFLKLVAGLSGVGLDALAQRDAQRRVRRVTYLTAAALAAMLAMAVLTAFAFRERQEAARQRADAEGMVEFMLTDLRTVLKGVGRTDVLAMVNRRALARYRDQDLARLPGDSLVRRARLLQAIGEDALTTGQMDAAVGAFAEARRVTGEQLARSPDDPQRLLAHARSEYWIGRVYELRQDWAAAQSQYLRYAAATGRLLQKAPADPAYMVEAASSAVDLGNVQLNGLGDPAAAERQYGRAVGWYERAARLGPLPEDVQLSEANAYAWLADSFFVRARWAESLAARRQQYAIVERLRRAHPLNVEAAYRFALAQAAISLSMVKLGDRAGGRRELLAAYRTAAQLADLDRDNAEWRLFRAKTGCFLYYSGLALPAGLSRSGLAKRIVDDGTRLARDRNPRAAEIGRCVAALEASAARVSSGRRRPRP